MVKQITIRDFEHFQDYGFFQRQINDMDVNNFGLTNLTGESWKSLKSAISPAFSIKSMKGMVNTIEKNSDRLIQYLNESFKSGKLNQNQLEIDSMIQCFTMDVITQVAFGIDVDAINNPNNEFMKFSDDIFSVNRFMLANIFPSLCKLLNIGIMKQEVTDFFCNISLQVLKERKLKGAANQKHNDVLDMMIRIQNDTLKTEEDANEYGLKDAKKCDLNDVMISKTMMQFFVDGYDSVSGALVLSLYFLACNPDVQNKAREEVDEIAAKCNGKLDGDSVNEMKYLECIFSETMRFSNFPNASRTCTIKWTIPGTDVVIPKDMRVYLPVYARHMDPNNFPDPEAFIPERFSQDRKGEIKAGTYLPFGIGPRQCMGIKLARMEAKILMYTILRNFILEPCSKTQTPLKYDSAAFLKLDGGAWLKFVPRG